VGPHTTPGSNGAFAPVRRAEQDEIDAVARLMSRAFNEDTIQQWCMSCDDTFGVIELELHEVTRQLTLQRTLWVTDDLSGVIAWMPPGTDYDNALLDSIVNPALAERGGQPERQVGFWEWADGHRPAEPHWYVDVVAVDPDRRGCGLGSHLLDDGLARLDVLGAPAHLITDKPRSSLWYGRHGFETQSLEDAPDGGPPVWFMWRPARKA